MILGLITILNLLQFQSQSQNREGNNIGSNVQWLPDSLLIGHSIIKKIEQPCYVYTTKLEITYFMTSIKTLSMQTEVEGRIYIQRRTPYVPHNSISKNVPCVGNTSEILHLFLINKLSPCRLSFKLLLTYIKMHYLDICHRCCQISF